MWLIWHLVATQPESVGPHIPYRVVSPSCLPRKTYLSAALSHDGYPGYQEITGTNTVTDSSSIVAQYSLAF